MAKLLFIAGTVSDSSPVAIRNHYTKNYLKDRFDYFSIGGSFKSNKKFIKLARAILRRVCLPDADVIYLQRTKKRIRKLNDLQLFDYFYIQILPFSNLYLCDYIKKIAPNSKIIVELTDPITINSAFPSFSLAKRLLLSYLEKNIMVKADRLVVLNDEIRKYYGHILDVDKIHVIEQGTEIITEIESLKAKKKLQGHIKFLYAGMLYRKIREPFALYEAIDNTSHNVSLTVIGNFKKMFIPPLNPKYRYSHRLSKSLIEYEYNSADVIVFLDNAESFQIPGKLFEVLATCKPIIFIYSNEESPSLKYAKKCEGIFIVHNNVSEITYAIDQICSLGYNWYQRNTESFLWSTILQKMDEIFEI